MRECVVIMRAFGQDADLWVRHFAKGPMTCFSDVKTLTNVRRTLKRKSFKRQKSITLESLFSSIRISVVWVNAIKEISCVHRMTSEQI